MSKNIIKTWFNTNEADSFSSYFKNIFSRPISSPKQWIIIIFVAFLFIFVPQFPPTDWDLNTKDLWIDGLNMYDDPNRVYPPWGLILLVPYFLMRAEGARVFSVLVIGWLSYRRGWPLSKFLAVVLGPYFLVTMSKSNMDVLVLVFPILLWESVEGSRWQSVGRGLALSVLLLKPQGAVFLWLYLLWESRDNWRELVKPLLVVALIVIPVSLLGTPPPLILQWFNNIRHPSQQNIFYWSINNISLFALFSPFSTILIFLSAYGLLAGLMKWRGKRWSNEHTLASLVFVSLLLSPYASQQSFSSALAFIPSWWSVAIQNMLLIISFSYFGYLEYIPLWIFLNGLAALYFYEPKSKITVMQHNPENIS